MSLANSWDNCCFLAENFKAVTNALFHCPIRANVLRNVATFQPWRKFAGELPIRQGESGNLHYWPGGTRCARTGFCAHCPPLCRRNRAPCTLAQSYRQRLPILIYGRIPAAFQLPKVRRLIGNLVSNCFSSMKARSPLAFSVRSSLLPFKHALPGIIAASTFAPPRNCRCRAGLDTFSPQDACSTVSLAGGSTASGKH